MIKKDNEGKFKRVWVEQKVRDPEELIKLQEEISKINPNFKPETPEGMHMALAHFGIPEELFADFKKVKPELSFARFMTQFYKLLQDCDGAMKEEIQVQAESLAIFGKTPWHVAVVKIVNTPELAKDRQVISEALQQFIRNLEVNDVHQFMLESPNLQFEPDDVYNPHTTLGFVGENTTLPQVDISDLKITLKPSDIGGVEKTSD